MPFVQKGRLKGKSTGGFAEQTYKHRARDAEGSADLRHCKLRQASMSRDVGARGSPGPQKRPARPRLSGDAKERLEYGVPGAAKNTGDDARLEDSYPAP